MTAAPETHTEAPEAEALYPSPAPATRAAEDTVERILVTPASYTDRSRPHTKGERKFDFKTHVGLDFIVNSIGSILLVSTVKLLGNDTYKGWESGVRNRLDRVPFLRGEQAKKIISERFVGLFTLSMLGHVLMWPIKKLKDNELEHVQRADARLQGGRQLTPQEERDRAVAYAAIELKPKQSAWTMTKSRAGSLVFANWLPFIALDLLFNRLRGETFDDSVIRPAARKIAGGLGLRTRGTETVQTVAAVTIMEIISCALTAWGVKFFMTLQERRTGHRQPRPEDTVELTIRTAPDGQVSVERRRGDETAPAQGAAAAIDPRHVPPSMRAPSRPARRAIAAQPAPSHEERYARGLAESETELSPAI